MNMAKSTILRCGRLTSGALKLFFDPNMDMRSNKEMIEEIRDWMEENGLDRHTPIELNSSEIVVATPCGILMEVRPEEGNMLALWGGIIGLEEEPTRAAARRLYEETGIYCDEDDLKFIEQKEHFYEYPNKDKVYFTTWRFFLKLEEMPFIPSCTEAVIVFKPTESILKHERKVVEKILREPYHNLQITK